jgi:pyridinium-3,5-bisthiocarboxylic acid mononucleotide nickel chelatase
MHDRDIEDVHFHEVGAVDAIVDIVGSCFALHAMGIERVTSTPIRVGTGTVRAAHGVLPVPAPATLELLRGYDIEYTDIPYEMTTPTGAAIITTLSEGTSPASPIRVDSIGYGAGTKDTDHIANLLRVEIGETIASAGQDEAVLLETNLDDMTAEVHGYVMEQLLAAGAKDVWITQVLMKKNRPGCVLSVLADAESRERLTGVILAETTTLGVRVTPVRRVILPRTVRRVETPWGPVSVKETEWDGVRRAIPEYEDCAATARRNKVALRRVYEAAISASSGSIE